MPPHDLLDVTLGFTRVARSTSPFPAEDPGAPFHKRDRFISIKEATDVEAQPFTFRTSQPVGHYYLVLRAMMTRRIRGKIGVQIENFAVGNGPVKIRRDATLQIEGAVTWPSVPDEQLHAYGSLDELIAGGA